MKKIVGFFVCMLLIVTAGMPLFETYFTSARQSLNTSEKIFPRNDVLSIPYTSIKSNNNENGPSPGLNETSEYMIGDIAIGVIFLESAGSGEDWTTTEQNNVIQKIQWSNIWWSVQYNYIPPNPKMSWTVEWNYNIPVSLEPINYPSACTNNIYEQQWVNESMASLGFNSGNWFNRVRSYNNDLRSRKNTDWAFTVFVIDSSNDADGCFTDNYWGYAYYGYFIVITYDCGPWTHNAFDRNFLHETAHIFWATDEYNSKKEYSGYLNANDNDGSGGLMDQPLAYLLSQGTKEQLGWRDTDSDGLLDIIDTNPDTMLNSYIPNPTSNTILTYTGMATVIPYTNKNPQPSNSKNNVTINTISNVEYRIDAGTWTNAQPTDGLFNSAIESYTFTTSNLSLGQHTIETRAIDSVGNRDISLAQDTVTIITNNAPNKPTITGPTTGDAGSIYTYTGTAIDPDGDQIYYWFDWGDGTNSGWFDPVTSGTPKTATHLWATAGNYEIKVQVKDTTGLLSVWSDPLPIKMPYSYKPILHFLELFFQQFLKTFPLLRQLISY